MFWRPDLYAQAVELAPCDDTSPSAMLFQPGRWPGRVEAREDVHGRHLLLRGAFGVHQIRVAGGLRPGQPMAVRTPIDKNALVRFVAAQALLRDLNGRKPPAPARRRDGRWRRYGQALDAFDGWRLGRSYREIAMQLHGGARVASDPWKTSSLRDGAIRLTRLGRQLVAGGYRALLARAPG